MSASTIKDGIGTGKLLRIDAKNRMRGFVTTEREEQSNNRLGDAYVAYLELTPTGANDNFFWMKNTDTRDLIVNWYRVWCASAEAIDIHRNPIGTPAGGSTATPINANFGSSKTADIEAYSGVNITGLTTTARTIDRLRISGDGKDVVDEWPGGLVIPQGGIICASALNGALPIEVTFSFFFAEPV
jgi:hypothetical protein